MNFEWECQNREEWYCLSRKITDFYCQTRAYLKLLALKSALLLSEVENFGGSKTRAETKRCHVYVKHDLHIPIKQGCSNVIN